MTKLWLGGAAVLLVLVSYLAWQNDRLTKKVNAANQRAWVAEQTAEIERENARKANEATIRESKRQDQLDAERRANPLPPVIVYRRSPGVSAACPSSPDSGEAVEANDAGEDAADRGRDIGPDLDDFATDAESNLIQCEELMRWVSER